MVKAALYSTTHMKISPLTHNKGKTKKAIQDVCVESDDDQMKSFMPKETSTDVDSSEDDTESEATPQRQTKRNSMTNMEDLVKGMALTFQTPAVQQSFRQALEPTSE